MVWLGWKGQHSGPCSVAPGKATILNVKREDFQDLYPVAVVVEEENTAAGHLLRLHHRLQVCQQAHVFAHVRRQHHVDHHLPQRLPLLLGQVDKDITVVVL